MRTLLCIGAHVGDMELTCGGLIATEALKGNRAVLVALTAGEKGNPPGRSVEEYREQKVEEARAPVKQLNRSLIRSALSSLRLRPGVSQDMAERYLSSLSASFKTLLASYTGEERDLHKVLTGVEELLSLFVFGMAEPTSGEVDIDRD